MLVVHEDGNGNFRLQRVIHVPYVDIQLNSMKSGIVYSIICPEHNIQSVYVQLVDVNAYHMLAWCSSIVNINPCPAELNNLYFHPLEVVSRYHDPQPQVGKNYSYVFNLRQTFANNDV